MKTRLIFYVIHLLNTNQRKYIYTSELINILTKQLNPIGHWKKILKNRKNTHFSQIVRNLVCHKDTNTNSIHYGSLHYDPINGFIFLK